MTAPKLSGTPIASKRAVSKNPYWRVVRRIVLLYLIILSGCRPDMGENPAPQKRIDPNCPESARLEERVEAMYTAQAGRKYEELRSIALPGDARDMMDYFAREELSKPDMEVPIKWSIIEISEDSSRAECDFAARVSMYVVVLYPDGRKKVAKDQTDYWVYKDKEWFWVWRGWPSD